MAEGGERARQKELHGNVGGEEEESSDLGVFELLAVRRPHLVNQSDSLTMDSGNVKSTDAKAYQEPEASHRSPRVGIFL